MRWIGRVLKLLVVAFVLLVVGILLFAEREPADLTARFDAAKFGEGVQVYFESAESAYDDIIPGVEKRVIWAEGAYEQRTPYSIVYLHGYSATSEEIRPVPDRVAEALGANLVYTRLRGHGRSDAEMGEATVAEWMADTAEALAAGQAVGEEVIVISTSTGGTLAAAAAVDPALSEGIAAMIFVSPNFGVNMPLPWVLTLPGIRYWGPIVFGSWQRFEPRNAGHAEFWHNSYPSVAVVPMAALVRAVSELDFAQATIPALFWFTDEDRVVRAARTRDVARLWGGSVDLRNPVLTERDDPFSHVIAGDIMSPGQTDLAVAGMVDWLAEQGIE